MGFPFVYCVVCGCPFDIPPFEEINDDRWANDDPFSDETKQWLTEFRLVGAPRCLGAFASPPVQEPKNESDIDGFFISKPADWAITDGFYFRLGHDEYRVLSSTDDGDVLIPLHERCLTIIRRALARRAELAPELLGSSPSLLDVYRALCTHFSRNVKESRRVAKESGYYGTGDFMNYGMEYDHGYYGAREFWAFDGWMQTRTNEWYCTDPIDIPGLNAFTSRLLTEAQPEEEHYVRGAEVPPETAGTGAPSPRAASCPHLEGLPPEIMDLIIFSLPTPSILALRQCSKTLASRLLLDQQFWRTQLLRGNLVPYLWDLGGLDTSLQARREQDGEKNGRPIEGDGWNWKGPARELARIDALMKADEVPVTSVPWGLRNRCRIWKMVSDILTSPVD